MKFYVYKFFGIFLFFSLSFSVFAENKNQEEFFVGKILQVSQNSPDEFGNIIQKLKIEILTTKQKIEIENGNFRNFSEEQKFSPGEQIVLVKMENGEFSIIENYRLSGIFWILIIFLLTVVAIVGFSGLGSVFGLFLGIFVVIFGIIPGILHGTNAIFLSVLSAIFITPISMILAHKARFPTFVAILSTFLTILLAIFFAIFAVKICKLFGLGDESAQFLQMENFSIEKLRGILFVGILLGTLGVLDDITAAQTFTVFKIYKTNPKQNFCQVFKSSFSIGREHINSMINTLAMAYFGASLPLFIIFSRSQMPFWVILNSEIVAEEIVRIIAGSFALILAVPISTFLATVFVFHQKKF